MPVIGELNPDGTIKTEATECAITGDRVLGEHHITQRISGTPYFYRYLSNYEHLLTSDKRAEIAALAGQGVSVEDDPDMRQETGVQTFKRKGKPEAPDQSTPPE